MKTKCFYFLIVLAIVAPLRLFGQSYPGAPMLFNDNWGFHSGDIPDGINGAMTNKGWENVQLPHDWSIQGPFSEDWASATAFLPGGIGWYKKSFTASKKWEGQQVYIYFDGVYKNSEVWINGHYLGKRPNGFIAFQYELTPYLNHFGKNTLIVKADHSEFADSRWYTGSGIYRNVYLVVKNPTHFNLWGVKFTTPEVSGKEAKVMVNASVSTLKKANLVIKIKLLDNTGTEVLATSKQLTATDSVSTSEISKVLQSPKLWSTDHPYLYTLVADIVKAGKTVDEVKQQVGIRIIKFDKDKGFFLNNISTKLKGVCIHDDAGALGVAVPKEVWQRRLSILKDAGINALRLSHNPHADYLYDLCDQMGFLVMDEAFDEWEIGKNKWVKGWNVGTPSRDGYHEYFKEWAEKDLHDMVARDFNHPSIILWSIGNEIDYPNDPYSNPILNTGKNPQIYGKGYLPDHPPASEITGIAKKLVSTVKAVDTTRPVTAALAGVIMSNEVGYPETLDIVGYNYQEYRYADDHKKYPNRVIYGSENSMQGQAWMAVDTNEFISGQFLWTGIDYMGEAGKWPARSNGAGLIDLAGFKKPEYFLRQSLWSSKPMVYIAAAPITTDDKTGSRGHRRIQHTWNWPEGSKLNITSFSNCDEVELLLNGKSLGKQRIKGPTLQIPHWDVDFITGTLLVKGYKNGNQVCSDILKTSGAPEAVVARADEQAFKAGNPGLSQVEIQITDKEGNPVYSAGNEVNFEIQGPGHLLGLESGSLDSHEPYQATARKALNGKLLAFIQTNGKAGTIKVNITSPGLQPATVLLKITK